jgi:hypothetical protein
MFFFFLFLFLVLMTQPTFFFFFFFFFLCVLTRSQQILQPSDNPTEHFEDFYEDIFQEMNKHGKVVDMVVCENAGVHLAGNTYIKFEDEEQATAAMAAVQGRFYAGRPLQAEFTPVTDFWEGICKQLEKEGHCGRSSQCNFMHLKKIGPDLERDLYPNGRAQSRGYSGGAYGRSDRMMFDRASSYDRGQLNDNYRGPPRRNYDRRNDRRDYNNNNNNNNSNYNNSNGGGDFQRRDYERRDYDRSRDYNDNNNYRQHQGPRHGGGGYQHQQQHNQHHRFDDDNAAYPQQQQQQQQHADTSQYHDGGDQQQQQQHYQQEQQWDGGRGRDNYRRDYERRPRSRSPRRDAPPQ